MSCSSIGLTNDIGRLSGEGFGRRPVASGEPMERSTHRWPSSARSPRRSASPRRPPRPRRRPHEGRRRLADLGASCASASSARRRPAELGVRAATRVALMLTNRPEFHFADLAAMTLGATPFSIYNDVLARADPVRGRRRRARRSRDRGASRRQPRARPARPRARARGRGRLAVEVEPGFDAEPHWRAIEPDDVLTLIYTSGPPGRRRASSSRTQPADRGRGRSSSSSSSPRASRVISWLPAAHIAERAAHHYLPIVYA